MQLLFLCFCFLVERFDKEIRVGSRALTEEQTLILIQDFCILTFSPEKAGAKVYEMLGIIPNRSV